MLEPELYGGNGVSDHHHHFKNHHRHYHNHHHHHHPSSSQHERGSSSGERKSSSSSRSSPRGHLHHSSSPGEKLKYQNAFSAAAAAAAAGERGPSSDGYFRYYPHQHSSYYDLSEKLDSLNGGKSESGSESRKNDSNNNNNSAGSALSNGGSEGGGSGGSRKKTTVVYVGDGRSRVRRVVRTQTRHITVVSYSGRKKDTETHTTHHATVLRYELSQDLLDKQIELLERKYGGVKARNAALTIQRAFRHYTMVKKFASITAMAKAEKRMSRRVQHQHQQQQQAELEMMQQQQHQLHQSHLGEDGQQQYEDGSLVGGQRVCATISATPPGTLHHRMTPARSMSLRERRLDSSPIPRSQSGNASPAPPANSCSWSQSPMPVAVATGSPQQYSHPHVNILHQQQQQQHYYSTGGIPSSSPHQQQQLQQYQSQYGSQDLNVSGGSSVLDSTISSMNLSWNSGSGAAIVATAGGAVHQSPYTPHYTAAQIYMRPRGIGIGSSGGSSGSTGSCNSASRKVPPEVPKRTSSITSQHTPNRSLRPNGLCKTAENGSLSSVQSSGSDSSASAERIQGVGDLGSDRSSSPQWKRKGPGSNSGSATGIIIPAQSPDHMMGPTAGVGVGGAQSGSSANVTISSMENECLSSHTSAAQYSMEQHDHIVQTPTSYKVSETIRKRQYRVGLNLFNKKPERGITYLIRKGFLENTPQGVARFLISRKGLSRQMIGEYLGNLQNQFNMAVLDCFAGELDLSGMQVDVALRKFQGYFRMPGEAQKIERLMEVFSARYCLCNADIVARLRSNDTVFVLAFAIIMLNTDLHTPNLKPERRMRCDDFIKNLRGIDDCHDIDRDMLTGIYERVKANEFKPGSDHVTQVMKVQATIVGKKPNLALPHRRLVCYCRLYEIPDINKKERPGVHQREVFLFNDLLVITKIFSKKKSSVTYTFRNSYPLCGMVVTLLDVPNYPYCIRLSQKVDNKVLVTFNARNEHDRCKFAEDLRESISEMDEMETLRIEAELERQKSARGQRGGGSNSENRDSGVADVEVCAGQYHHLHHHQGSGSIGGVGGGGGVSPSECGIAHTHSDAQLKRSALSNSLLDMHEQFGNEKPQRRGSVGSLDSGMSISFQSTSASTGSRSDIKVRMLPHSNTSGQIIMHAGQHATALMGAIYHQQIVQQHVPPAAAVPPPTQPINGQLPQSQQVLAATQPNQLTAASAQPMTRRERKLSRSEDSATMAAANGNASGPAAAGPTYGRSTEV
nr:IQ motif and SEC7 domain-containing protein 1-like isoform X2 [Aedes albopictus]